MKKFAKSLSLLAVFALASTVWAAPLDAFKDLEGKLDIAGGTAHIPVMTQAARDIMTFNPKIRITVAGGGSGVGVKQVGEGLAQIGNTGRPLKPAEIEKYGLVSFPFAIDGVALAVHPSNPVKALTKEQAVAIYTGKITDWKELGGEPGAIDVYGREDGSGTRETFQGKVMGKVEQMPSVNTVSSNGAMKTAIAQDPRAIGYVGSHRRRRRGDRRPCAFAGERGQRRIPRGARSVHEHEGRTDRSDGGVCRLRFQRTGREDHRKERLYPSAQARKEIRPLF